MQFLALSRRRTDAFPPEAFTPELIEAEGQRVRELYTAGSLRSIWRRQARPGPFSSSRPTPRMRFALCSQRCRSRRRACWS